MKNKYQILTGIVMGFLMLGNILLFAHSLSVGDAIQKVERETQQIKIANLELEKQLSSINSLESLTKDAQILGFVKEAQPVNLDHFASYALAK